MPAYQRILQTDGSVREVYAGRLTYDPDPDHRHWLFSGFAEHRLSGAGGVRRSRKQAFCLVDFDRLRRRAPDAYRSCRPTRMGSRRAGRTTYTWDLHGQHIDITTLPSGTYRLESVANPSRRLRERSRTGDRATIRLRFDKDAEEVTILR